MLARFKTIVPILGLFLVSSCNSDGSGGEEDYVSSKDKKLCDCYRERHHRINVDYDSELKKEFKFVNSKFKQFKRMDRKSLLDLISAIENGHIDIGVDSSEILDYRSELQGSFLSECVEWDSYFNNESKEFKEMVDSAMDLPYDSSRKSWKIRMKARRQMLKRGDDGQWLNPYYIFMARNVYRDYKSMLDFEDAKYAQEKIDAARLRRETARLQQQAEVDEYMRLNPPPMPVPPPEIEDVPEVEYEEY